MFKTNVRSWLVCSASKQVFGLLAVFSFFFLPPWVFWVSLAMWGYLTFRYYMAFFKFLLLLEPAD